MCLRLGTSICASHICQHFGTKVSAWDLHGLSCRSSEGRHMRHSTFQMVCVPVGVPVTNWFNSCIVMTCLVPYL